MPSLGWRWLIVAARAALILFLLAVAVPLHLVLRLFRHGDAVPPRFLQAVGWAAGLRVRRLGRPAEGRRLLLVANHTSWLDILALAGASGSAFVARGDLAGHPVLKWLCEQNDTLFIRREGRRSVGGEVTQLSTALSRRRMTVFPEGTTSDGKAILPFKSALFSAAEAAEDVTVQPVALAFEHATVIAWAGEESGVANTLRVLSRTRSIRLTVRFLPPLAGPERANRKAMAAAAQRRIADSLGLPIAGPIA